MEWSLFDRHGRRKYLAPLERKAFLGAALRIGGPTASFCAVLVFSGARISEVLALTPDMIDDASCAINFHTLKRNRKKNGKQRTVYVVVRSVPMPRRLLGYLNDVHRYREQQYRGDGDVARLWSWSRTTAWRRVKAVMLLARIPAYVSQPKAVRHAFGAAATIQNITLSMIKKWLGHADIRTTAIYTTVIGKEERALAQRAWGALDNSLRWRATGRV
jgi:integrase/recombinase XerD